MSTLPADLRHAVRGFRHSPVFTATAVLTVALGVGGTTAIFSLIHAVMLRSLPVADPASLYRIGDGNDCCVEGFPQSRWGLYSYPLVERLKAATPEFEKVAAFQASAERFSVRRADVERIPRPVRGEFVTGNYFDTFGIHPFAGRLLTEADDKPAAPPVAVLSYRVWQSNYGGDPAVIGASFVINGQAFSVSGIAPPGFYGETLRSDPPDLWIPVQQEPLLRGSGSLLSQSVSAWLRVIGRLRPGATVEGMGPRLTGLLRQWIEKDAGYPPVWMPEIRKIIPKQVIEVVPAGAGVAEMKEDYGRSLQILLAVCALVLLIACANLANLLLARSVARRRQTSIRLAVGASLGAIVRQSLAESLLLAIAGGVAGLLIADGAQRLILFIAFRTSHSLPIATSPNLPVLGFAFALSLLTGFIFGAAPAWFATRTDPVEALRGAGRSTSDTSLFTRNVLLVLQATLSIVLVAGAAMLARSLDNIENQNLGFETRDRLTVALGEIPTTYPPERLNALYPALEERVRRIPGVEQTSLALYNPFTDNWGELIFIEGQPTAEINENATASWDRVSVSYFKAAGQPLIRGREFSDSDRMNTAPVAIVNESFVRRFFQNQEPLDKYFGIDLPENARTYRIVGVVRDAKYTQPEKPARPMFFVPMAQYVSTYQHELLKKIELRSHYAGNMLLATSISPSVLEPALRKAVAEVDSNLSINSVRTMQEQVGRHFDQRRAVAGLAGLFGVIALLLAAVGLYGITAYTVTRRTGEIGIRMALGAAKPQIVRLVLRGAFLRVAIGLGVGIPLSIGAGQLLSSQLYGLTGWDPVSIAVATAALGLCAFIAAIIPAARASAIDPMKALRVE